MGSDNSGPSPSAILVSAVSGAAITGAAIYCASRFRTSALTQRLQNMEQSLARTTSSVQKSLQSQELVIEKSLKPVAAAQLQLTHIDRDVAAIKTIFHPPQALGYFGEFQLETLIQNVMPSPELYEFQHTLSNNRRVDCLLKLASPIGKLAIDSKFPLVAFQEQMSSETGSENAQANTKEKKRKSLFKHIHDIASKYIIAGETANYAIMFIPSEAVFLRIVQDYPDIVLHANRNVYIASPTTLMALITQMHRASHGMALQELTDDILGLVQKLMGDVDRLSKHYDLTEKSLKKAKSELTKMDASIDNIRKHKAKLDGMGE